MERVEILVDEQRMYTLFRSGTNQLFLEVVTGGIAMETVVVPLNKEEQESYAEQGKPFLDDFAFAVCRDANKYRRRVV